MNSDLGMLKEENIGHSLKIEKFELENNLINDKNELYLTNLKGKNIFYKYNYFL